NNNYYDQQRQMSDEIARLSDEVTRLREELQYRPSVPPAPVEARPPAPPEPAKPTVLVFRDKRTQEVNNYAIVGQTLWVLTEQRARKIALAELDLPATAKLNDERGVDFRVPDQKTAN